MRVRLYTGRPSVYSSALLEQNLAARAAETGDKVLLVMRHQLVVTYGRDTPAGKRNHALYCDGRQIPTVDIDRAGQATVHNEHQLMVYYLTHIPDTPRAKVTYLTLLQEVILGFLNGCVPDAIKGSFSASKHLKHPGVFFSSNGQRPKVAAIGVEFRPAPPGFCTTLHGAAVYLDKAPQTDIVYLCGEPEQPVTSLADILQKKIDPDDAMDRMVQAFVETAGEKAPIIEINQLWPIRRPTAPARTAPSRTLEAAAALSQRSH